MGFVFVGYDCLFFVVTSSGIESRKLGKDVTFAGVIQKEVLFRRNETAVLDRP